MNRTVEARLRRLEASAPAKRVRLVFSTTSNEAEWDREIAVMITSGWASKDDQFVGIGWMVPSEGR
jgi:hypothetical protein